MSVTLYPTLKDLTVQKCFHIKMFHKILCKWIWNLLKAVTHLLCFSSEEHNMLMVLVQTRFASKKEMQNVRLIAKRKSICVICFPWKDRSSCCLIDEMLYTKLTVINTIPRCHFKSCEYNALEYVLWHLHCYLLGIKSSSCLKHLYWGKMLSNFKWQYLPREPIFEKPGADCFLPPISLLKTNTMLMLKIYLETFI